MAACGDDGGGSSTLGGADPGGGGADAADAPGDANTSVAGGGCTDVEQTALDAVVPGLEPVEPDAPPASVNHCIWEAAAGDGSFMLQLLEFQLPTPFFYESEELFGDTIEIDLCDRGFWSPAFGSTAVFYHGDTAVQVALTEILVPDDMELSDEESRSRVEAFAGTIAERVC